MKHYKDIMKRKLENKCTLFANIFFYTLQRLEDYANALQKEIWEGGRATAPLRKGGETHQSGNARETYGNVYLGAKD